MHQSRISHKFYSSIEEFIPTRYSITNKVVMTNGCFDLLHPGHIYSLEESKKLGDVLIVILNSDTSVRELKGNFRPLFNEEERAKMLCALSCVDYVILSPDNDVCKPLSVLHPDVWTKGSDRNLDTLNQEERKIAESNNIDIRFIVNREGISTTNIFNKILNIVLGVEDEEPHS